MLLHNGKVLRDNNETSISPAMIMEYSRCDIGKRCVIKTDNNFVFKKFTLLSAISNQKCIGWILYEKGGSTKERFVDFLQNYIFQKYKNYLLVLDNARAHNNNLVKESIIDIVVINIYLQFHIHQKPMLLKCGLTK